MGERKFAFVMKVVKTTLGHSDAYLGKGKSAKM